MGRWHYILTHALPGADPTKHIEDLAKRRRIKTLGVSMGQGQEVIARNFLSAATADGQWLLLQNTHLGLAYLTEVRIPATQSEHLRSHSGYPRNVSLSWGALKANETIFIRHEQCSMYISTDSWRHQWRLVLHHTHAWLCTWKQGHRGKQYAERHRDEAYDQAHLCGSKQVPQSLTSACVYCTW